MKRKAIIFDCDDILLNYMEGFKKFLGEHYNIYPRGLPDDYVLSSWVGCTDSELQAMIKHFNEKSFEFGLLDPLDDHTVQKMKLLKELCSDKVDFIVLTKCGTFGHSTVLRKVNLINTFGDIFDDIIIIETYESKKGSIKRLQVTYDVLCLVDDYVKNIDDSIECGINSVLIERTHNIKHKGSAGYNFVQDWQELYLYLHDVVQEHVYKDIYETENS